MLVPLSELTGFQATSLEVGQQVYELIEPAIARGETVVLDFDGVRYFNPGFFAGAIGRLIEQDAEERLPALLRYENLNEMGQSCVESVTEHWTLRRKMPGYGQGWDEAARRYSEQWRQ